MPRGCQYAGANGSKKQGSCADGGLAGRSLRMQGHGRVVGRFELGLPLSHDSGEWLQTVESVVGNPYYEG